MAEQSSPTYRVEPVDDHEQFRCLIPDAGQPEGRCDFVASTLAYMTDHMQQRHSGIMLEEHTATPKDEGEAEEADDAPADPADSPDPPEAVIAEADPIATPRTPDSQEAPPRGAPTPQLPTPTPLEPTAPSEEKPPAPDAAGAAA